MHPFKKMILQLCSSETTPLYYIYSGLKGDVGCTNGQISFINSSPITLYSSSSTLEGGRLYEDTSLQIVTTIVSFKKGTTIYDISDGYAGSGQPVGSAC
jgi:hypothetical protein